MTIKKDNPIMRTPAPLCQLTAPEGRFTVSDYPLSV